MGNLGIYLVEGFKKSFEGFEGFKKGL